MPRDYRLYLKDLRTAAEKVLRYTRGMTFEQFLGDERTFDAVVHNLEIISDAAREVPDELRERHPEAEWDKLAGLHDLVITPFFGVDAHVLWDVVQQEVPPLLEQVEAILAAELPPEPEAEGQIGELAKVASTMLYAIGYDETAQVLETIFYSGGIYRYFGVPREVYEGLRAAPSKGRYMWANVINAFPYERVRRRR